MRELEAIAAAGRRAVDAGRTPVLATVVDVAGSAYRRPGAHMLVTSEGWQAGSISGGCLEGDIVRRGAWLTRAGPVTLAYDTSGDEEATYGLGCGGRIRVLLERLDEAQGADLLAFMESCVAQRRPGVVATVVATAEGRTRVGERLLFADGEVLGHRLRAPQAPAAVAAAARRTLAAGRSSLEKLELAGAATEVFLEYLAAPTPLLVFGAGHDAPPVVKLAKSLGFHVTLVDGRPTHASTARFPQADEILLCLPDKVAERVPVSEHSVALVMTHHFASDRRILAALLQTPAAYIGVLGPRRRTEELLAGVESDHTSQDLRRLYAPVGLDLGAEGPEGIALAILAEVQAVLAGRGGGHLRDRATPIHGGAG